MISILHPRPKICTSFTSLFPSLSSNSKHITKLKQKSLYVYVGSYEKCVMQQCWDTVDISLINFISPFSNHRLYQVQTRFVRGGQMEILLRKDIYQEKQHQVCLEAGFVPYVERWGFLIIHNSHFSYVYTCRGIILWI